MKVQAYMGFEGNCQEALQFYAKCFDADIVNRQTYADRKIDVPSSYRAKLQHAELKGKGVHFMAYDVAPDTPLTDGTRIHLSIDVEGSGNARDLYEKLSEQGRIHHALREREWNALFARFTDKFGVQWMLNCDL